MTSWRQATVAPCGSHHVVAGRPLYAARFDEVLKFHEPGLAPVRLGGEAWHIDVAGAPAYRQRFRQTFGFYDHRAAVEASDGWCHVRPDGTFVGSARFAWCGNYQEARCTVRDGDGLFLHLDLEGVPVGTERHLYAGDFRDGLAVVRGRSDGLCTHVDRSGQETHRVRFLDLDVFHKGFARARDAAGWFHIGLDGRAAYDLRFENVEPFYNGLALVWTRSGERLLVDRSGAIRHTVTPAVIRPGVRAKVLVLGNVGAGKTTLARPLAEMLGWRFTSIDDCRRAYGDGSPSGELRAWAAFVGVAGTTGAAVMECTGLGPHVPLLRLALRESGDRVGVLWVQAPVAICTERARGRAMDIPYPRFGASPEAVAATVDARIPAAMSPGGTWHSSLIGTIDGTEPGTGVVDRAVSLVANWRDTGPCAI